MIAFVAWFSTADFILCPESTYTITQKAYASCVINNRANSVIAQLCLQSTSNCENVTDNELCTYSNRTNIQIERLAQNSLTHIRILIHNSSIVRNGTRVTCFAQQSPPTGGSATVLSETVVILLTNDGKLKASFRACLILYVMALNPETDGVTTVPTPAGTESA